MLLFFKFQFMNDIANILYIDSWVLDLDQELEYTHLSFGECGIWVLFVSLGVFLKE